MNSLALIKKYGDIVDTKILIEYKRPDKFIFVNTDDKDLIPIRIELPNPPEYHLIEGFGLPASEQMFTPPKLPRRLKELQKKGKTLFEIWETLENNQDIYEEENKFINNAWYYRLNGYWFFNNGKPTYIDGWHYFFCSWWNIDIGLPKYRSRDRKFFLFARMCYTETKTFESIDKVGNAIVSEETGYYDLIETGSRVFYGFNYPKHRREGATYKAECIGYEIISRTSNASGGIQSQNEGQAKDCFIKHLVNPWKRLPFFFKPNYEGSTSPKTELSFSPPATRLSSKGALASSDEGLESKIDYTNAEAGAYDGWKLYFHHDDEVGKLTGGVSCWARHLVVKECLQQGAGKNIIGFTIKTSTVGEMERGGGKTFKTQCELSDYFTRTPNGQTISGLTTLFIPAYDGLEGFIDRYGDSVVDTPTKEQAIFINSKVGAREHLLNNRKGFIDSGNFEALSEETRKYPMSFTECFRTSARDSGFNMQKLESRIDELRFDKSVKAVEGDFRWKDNVPDGNVEFVARKGGKFIVSHQLNDNESNRKYWDDISESWRPSNTSWGVAGSDTFKFNKTKGNRLSDGGGAVVRKGKIKDGDFSQKRKFVCTYANRPINKNLYGEDMLMMSIYYGVQMFPEINIPFIWDYFEERGYADFLLYRVDPKNLQTDKTPGGQTSEKIKQQIFAEYMLYIDSEIDEETHIEVLEECRDISGPEEMTDYDLFTAGGYALLGTASVYTEIEEINNETVDYGKYVKKRTYKRN